MSYDGDRLSKIFALMPPPKAANWTLRQTSTNGVLADIPSGGVSLFAVDRTIGEDTIIADLALPSTPFTITAGFLVNIDVRFVTSGSPISGCGLVLYETGTTKIRGIPIYNESTNIKMKSAGQTGLTGSVSSANVTAANTLAFGKPLQYQQITDDGTTRTYLLSTDGVHFKTWFSETRTTGFTTAPDRIGIAIYPRNMSAGIALMHWSQT